MIDGISGFMPQYLAGRHSRSPSCDGEGELKAELNFSELFWGEIFSDSNIAKICRDQFHLEHLLELVYRTKKLFTGMSSAPIFPHDAVFLFHALKGIVSLTSSQEALAGAGGEQIDLTHGIFIADPGLLQIKNATKFSLREDTLSYRYYQKFCDSLGVVGVDPIFVLHFFWPQEIIGLMVLARILRRKYGKLSIIVSAETANEQFDYSTWRLSSLIDQQKVWGVFDAVSTHKNMPLARILKDAPGKTNLTRLFNKLPGVIIPRSGRVVFTGKKTLNQEKQAESEFIDQNNPLPVRPVRIFGKKVLRARIFPGGCYWSRCTFCAINKGSAFLPGPEKLDRKASIHIKKMVDLIGKSRADVFFAEDQAISSENIKYFAEQIIKRRLAVRYLARIRYSPEMKPIDFELLYRSGCRVLGIGLESANPGINLKYGKHKSEVSLAEQRRFISSAARAGIRTHQYAILGFPEESVAEVSQTFRYLMFNIQKNPGYTASPNLFYYHAGSAVGDSGERGRQWDRTLALSYLGIDGKNAGQESFRVKTIRSFAEKILLMQFDNIISKKEIMEFWNFIDYSGIFYQQKMFFEGNPYRNKN